jgi:hypothetical protein
MKILSYRRDYSASTQHKLARLSRGTAIDLPSSRGRPPPKTCLGARSLSRYMDSDQETRGDLTFHKVEVRPLRQTCNALYILSVIRSTQQLIRAYTHANHLGALAVRFVLRINATRGGNDGYDYFGCLT